MLVDHQMNDKGQMTKEQPYVVFFRASWGIFLAGSFGLDLQSIEMNRSNITAPYNSILGTDGRVI